RSCTGYGTVKPMNARLTLAAFVLAGASSASLVRANEGPQIHVEPPSPDAGNALRIDVDASWNDACPPRFESATLDGFDIVVRAVRDEGRCSKDITPYRASAGLDDANTLTPSRDGTYRVRYEVREAAQTEPELHGFRLLQVGEAQELGFVPETGVWWPELGG